MNTIMAALASASCSLRYCVADDPTGWWLFAAVALLVYAWRHRDD
jgi:hypothetical protein